MKFYKLVQDNTIIGAINENNFWCFNPITNMLYPTLNSYGEYVNYNNSLYRDYWMKAPITDKFEYENILIEEITQNEYNVLVQAIENNEVIEEEVVEEETPPSLYSVPIEEEDPDITLEFIRSSKINEMSHVCNQIIENGCDVVLTDGENHHFSLTIQDQLNLITLSSMAASGMEAIPYHADGELCCFYTPQDIQLIIAAATNHKTYHTTYFNALKTYINSLENINDISNIYYGVQLPEEYQSDVLKALLAQ